ncbi:MAG: response regulator [Thioploca sp.]|nr:response regulator [Thioploca sp.]
METDKTIKGTLLVVDDMPDNIKILLKILTQLHFKVLAARDGQQGIKIADYVLPDLILLDIMMPEMDGFEVCRYLKSQARTQAIPIIFMTALDDVHSKIKGFECGAADYITKPFQHKEVIARVDTHIHLHQLQQQLQAQMKELEKRNKELDAFAHTVAHDLKNPLNGVINLTEVLLETCPFDTLNPAVVKCKERLQVVTQAGYQMLNIIESMLLLAGVSKQETVTLQPLDMAKIIDQVVQSLSSMLTEYQAEIKLPPEWPLAKGYAPWVQEIWINYLTNGLKYGGNPPVLELGTSPPENGMICFWVQDNGSGITETEQHRLFTPFTRLQEDRAHGHGLGLSIVQQIAEKLGGQVGVESAPGKGSLFFFTLPVE